MAAVSSYLSSAGNFAENVAMQIKKDIQTHRLKNGMKLIPLRKLAGQYDVSYPIMQKAVNLLCREGLLSSKQGSGVFVKNQNAQAFSSQAETNKKIISITFCGFEKYLLTLPVYSRLLYGIEKEASRQGMDIVISLLRDPERFCQTDTYTNSYGFLLIGDNIDSLASFFKDKTAVCVMGTGETWCDRISYDNKGIGIIAAEQLVARGHKNLVSINIHPGHGEERCRAFNDRARSLGAEVSYFNNPEALVETRFEHHIESSVLQNWVKQIGDAEPRPDGIFVVDLVAQPLYSLLAEKGIKPGRDVEIATSNWHSSTPPGLQYRPLNIEQHPEEIGAIAVHQLLRRHENHGAKKIVINIESEIEMS